MMQVLEVNLKMLNAQNITAKNSKMRITLFSLPYNQDVNAETQRDI